MKKYNALTLLFLTVGALLSPVEAQRKKKKDYLVTINTEAGPMRLVLFDETPLHKANFIKLAQEKFYDGLLFHRIIEAFMVQGGDPDSRNAKPKEALGNGNVGYKIPAEIRPEFFHQKGALGAARDNNPQKESSGCQFYIVEGRPMTGADLDRQLERATRKPTEAQKKVYQTLGGSPHLDGGYTVFGQVIDGLAVIDSIAARPRDARDRPLKDISMQVSVEQMKKKKITKKYGYSFK